MLELCVCFAMPDEDLYLQIKGNTSASGYGKAGAFPLGRNLCAGKDRDCCVGAASKLKSAIGGMTEQGCFAAMIAFGFPKRTATLIRNGLAVGKQEVEDFKLPETSFEFYTKNYGDIDFTDKSAQYGKNSEGFLDSTLDIGASIGKDIWGVTKGSGQAIAATASKGTNAVVGGSVTAGKAIAKFAAKNIGTIATITVCAVGGAAFPPIITLCIAKLVMDAAEVAWDSATSIQDVVDWARTVYACSPSCDAESNGKNENFGDCDTNEQPEGPGVDCIADPNNAECAKAKQEVNKMKQLPRK